MEDDDKGRVDIPIKRIDLVMFDNTVSAVKEKFVDELKQMDEELEKFSVCHVVLSNQINHARLYYLNFKKIIDRLSQTESLELYSRISRTLLTPSSSDLARLSAESRLQPEMGAARKSCERQYKSSKSQSNWDSIASSPLVDFDGKNNTLKLQFDVSQFDPNEVTVKIQNDTLVITAAHEENCKSSSTSRQYHREFKFPKGVDPCTINSTLSKDGVLTVQAPLPQQATTDSNSRCSPKRK